MHQYSDLRLNYRLLRNFAETLCHHQQHLIMGDIRFRIQTVINTTYTIQKISKISTNMHITECYINFLFTDMKSVKDMYGWVVLQLLFLQ